MANLNSNGCVDCRKRSDMFKNLNPGELEHVDMCRVKMHYNVGEMIFKQGSPCYDFVCVTSGLVKLYVENGSDRRLIIGFAKPVDYIFVPGAYVDKRHHFSAMACEETTACLVEAEIIQGLIKTNPDFSYQSISKISAQAINLFEQLTNLTQKQMPGRMADMLINLSTKVYESNPFFTHLSRQDFADLSGMTKESAIRVLKIFKDDGLIKIEGDLIHILDMPRLEGISRNG